MADNNSVVQSVNFYELSKNSLWLSIVHNKQWNRFLLDIRRKFSYTNDGETKEGLTTIYLNLIVTKALGDQLVLALNSPRTFRTTKVRKFIIYFV